MTANYHLQSFPACGLVTDMTTGGADNPRSVQKDARAPITRSQLVDRQRWTAELYARARSTYDCARLEWSTESGSTLFAQSMIQQASARAAADMSGVAK